MRACILFGLLIFGAASIVVTTPNLTQGQGKKGGGGPGGAAGKMSMDAGTLFEMLSKSRGYFLISETRSLQGPLTQYAQEKGISNNQISRPQFLEFHAQYKAKLDAGGGGTPFGAQGGSPFGGPGGNPFVMKGKKGDMGGPGMNPGGPPLNPADINAEADAMFQRYDKNGDGKLNQDEMPRQLKMTLTRFDKNGDSLIDMTEFRDYYFAFKTGDLDPTGGRNSNSIVIDEDELDRQVVVLRAGKLPANMPEWFKEYDLDKDGQVALFEWRKIGKKSLDEFTEWDLNDDGFITPEEALKRQALLAKDNPKAGRPGGMGFGPNGSMDPNDKKAAFGKNKNKGGDPTAENSWANKGNGNKKGKGGKGGFGGGTQDK